MKKPLLHCIDIKPLPGNEIAPPLEEGKIYVNIETFKCECGQLHYYVGEEIEENGETVVKGLVSKYNYVRCYGCERELPDSGQGGKHWAHPKRFVSMVQPDAS